MENKETESYIDQKRKMRVRLQRNKWNSEKGRRGFKK